MSDEAEEIDLAEFDVDPVTGEIVKVEAPTAPIDTPKTIRGSVSLVKDFMRCPAAAYGRITRQPQTKGMALVQGIAVHEGLEKYAKGEGDAHAVFEKSLIVEAEKNSVSLASKDGDDARRIGGACIAAGKSILDHPTKDYGKPLREVLPHDYIERGFVVYHNGHKFSGKIDYVRPMQDGRYMIADWKTGKSVPGDFELKEDLQFSMYAYACYTDPQMKLTHGVWMAKGIYIHLRGQSLETHPSGKRKSLNETKDKSKIRFDFPTSRTQDEVEQHFIEAIDPAMEAMEANVWFRKKGRDCSWCGYFSKTRQRCEVEIPQDGIARREEFKARKEAEKASAMPMLFPNSVVDESRKASLKPYSDRNATQAA